MALSNLHPKRSGEGDQCIEHGPVTRPARHLILKRLHRRQWPHPPRRRQHRRRIPRERLRRVRNKMPYRGPDEPPRCCRNDPAKALNMAAGSSSRKVGRACLIARAARDILKPRSPSPTMRSSSVKRSSARISAEHAASIAWSAALQIGVCRGWADNGAGGSRVAMIRSEIGVLGCEDAFGQAGRQ